MKEFEFIKYLLAEVEEEAKKIIAKDELFEKYRKADKEDEDYLKIRQEYWDASNGSMAKVKECLKMVRRLSLEAEKKIGGKKND